MLLSVATNAFDDGVGVEPTTSGTFEGEDLMRGRRCLGDPYRIRALLSCSQT